MTTIKPRIFIGSSTEGRAIAKIVEKELEPFADCQIWERQFELGHSTLEDLINKLSLYDYGILVATADDVTVSRNKGSKAIRDNIVFEFGLFAGRLGRERAFLLAESGVKVPSDLNGITLPFFPTATPSITEKVFGNAKEKAQLQKERLIKNCIRIKDHIKGHERMYGFGFLPSTALAYGYYNDFVLKAMSRLIELKKLQIGHTCPFPKQCQKDEHAGGNIKNALNETPFDEIKFTILIPATLSADMFDRAKDARRKSGWEQIKIDAGEGRPFDFYVQGDITSTGILQLSDIPITLNSLREAVKAYIKKSYVGIKDAEELLEAREIRVFQQVLDFLIQSNPITKTRVETVLVN